MLNQLSVSLRRVALGQPDVDEVLDRDGLELLGEEVFPDDLAHASRKMKLYFSSDGARPPVLDANGLPTEVGTTQDIPLWLESMKSAFEGSDA
mgnify:CR=1 FL=1